MREHHALGPALPTHRAGKPFSVGNALSSLHDNLLRVVGSGFLAELPRSETVLKHGETRVTLCKLWLTVHSLDPAQKLGLLSNWRSRELELTPV